MPARAGLRTSLNMVERMKRVSVESAAQEDREEWTMARWWVAAAVLVAGCVEKPFDVEVGAPAKPVVAAAQSPVALSTGVPVPPSVERAETAARRQAALVAQMDEQRRRYREAEARNAAAMAQRRQEADRVRAERERRQETEFQDGYGRWWPRESVQWWGPQGRVDCTRAPNPDRYLAWFRERLEVGPIGAIMQGSQVSIVGRGRLSTFGRDEGVLYADLRIALPHDAPGAAQIPERLRSTDVSLATSYTACRSLLAQNVARVEAAQREWIMDRRRAAASGR